MGSDDEVMSRAADPERDAFAGDLFMWLAAEGRLVLDQDRADQVIAELEETLQVVVARVRLLELWRRLSGPVLDDLDADVEQSVVDTVFADQLAPGRLERALRELPKYVQAFKTARVASPPQGHGPAQSESLEP